MALVRIARFTVKTEVPVGRLMVLLVAVALFVTASGVADAKCGTGNAISYDDISAVLVQHDGCGVGRSQVPVDQFLCSAFWALFSDGSAVNTGAKPSAAAVYNQFNLAGGVGIYRLDPGLDKVRVILQGARFFDLSPIDNSPDTGEITITVKRCAIVTRFRASLMPETEGPALGLGFKMMSLVQEARKTKLSPTPAEFSYDIFFDK